MSAGTVAAAAGFTLLAIFVCAVLARLTINKFARPIEYSAYGDNKAYWRQQGRREKRKASLLDAEYARHEAARDRIYSQYR